MAVYRRAIPVRDPRLGRHVEHDDRSRRFPFDTRGLSIVSVVHRRHIGILDQGDLGSCTGNAGIGALATDPIFASLPVRDPFSLDETGAVRVYSDAEVLDGNGPYPPNDVGSSGLSVAKVLKADGVISGYQHTFTLTDTLKALSQYPILIGTDWTSDMFHPDPDGRVHPTGDVQGGHEYVCREIDADAQVVWCDNSWGTGWGKAGRFCLTFTDLGALLSREGDVIVLLPLTVPAPVPIPAPPAPATVAVELASALHLNGWVDARHSGTTAKVALAARHWLDAMHL